jgi:tRNA(adenine34) deaminase
LSETADRHWMEQAINLAKTALVGGQHPFGAVVTGQDGSLVAAGYNLVERDYDPSAHGEVVAIRAAGKALGSEMLTGCTLYTTCEPCLMCGSLIIRCGISRVVYGARSSDLFNYQATLGHKFEEVTAWANQQAGSEVISVTPGFMREECLTLYANWPERPQINRNHKA